mmetsp:Transcript_48405/g.58593  ORF Transcript_48405/g.58593 Transcript_48405/m.58593 type:complete len:270 (+) Transcript_48405:126-935(+)|eukprot:CAMPEP_0172501758 /NCGR_PEP_ID=MMETSP1066-20121228/153174_1 /TAXON_ID=671091 /ORGANISM="Coscinodiscus wailesii, Strain CCMP2513" /LENGTH=269 /DNA_ID=CAMNT_0013276725 /DNA_START=121 /DNA_END=930 /DNA_ORIENTATION=+
MSFQDVGKSGAKRNQTGATAAFNTTTYNASGGVKGSNGGGFGGGSAGQSSSGGYSQASDGILQYQRNVGILDNIIKQVGTKADGPVLQTQFKVQVDVIRQLGSKIEKQLRDQEISIESMPRSDAARSRATHVKLTKDFRRVETAFKNLQLEARRKKDLVEAQRREREENERKKLEGGASDTEAMRLQIQMQQERINEEIMREREEEIRNINKGMHTVNEIYKDLANIVGSQQEDIDQIETTMEDTNEKAKSGLTHIEKANASQGQCVIS